MDALQFLRDKIDLEKLMKHFEFEEISHDGRYIRSCCKLHGGDNPSSFVVNTENNLYYCHTGGCGGGDAYTLVQEMLHIPFQEAVKWVANFFNVDITSLDIQERKEQFKKELEKFISVMNRKKSVKTFEPFVIHEEMRELAKFRSFNIDTIDTFGLRYVEKAVLKKRDGNDFTLRNRLYIPIIHENVVIGASFRRTREGDNPKWLHQPHSIETNKLLYNYHNALSGDEIIVCEGLFDVWAYHEIGLHAVATFGAHLTDEQYRLLIKSGKDIVLSYDGDDAGRKATKSAKDMLRRKATLFEIEFKEGQDPENISREELAEIYEQRRRII